ncbi:TRAP transporter small permease [Aliifodinibius salicampi]|uniref:TRAP transporter small permease n=1 Tax=Fodinibius salicampi TaxID=1920655 RepID=A0ABT3PUH1_9BACT|nr:TRAP transporter small permease [Fodinibius salicampi]MCW9711478.1 TRAP transporter small permease [Fodinibius salicampi]
MRKQIDRLVRGTLVFLMGFMLFNVVWQVISRYIIGSPSTFTEELARFLLIWICLLGGAYAAGKKMHLSINLLPNRLSKEGKRKLSIFTFSIVILFALLVMVIGGGRLVQISYVLGQSSSALNIPLAYIYIVLPLSGLLIIYYKVIEIKQLFKTDLTPQKTDSQ